MSEESDQAAATATLVENERVKLIATLLNTLASGSVLAGIVIPAASVIAGTAPTGTSASGLRFLIGAISWLSAGVVLHCGATCGEEAKGMTAETYLLFVAPFLVLGFGLTIAAIEEVSWRRRRQHAYARTRRRDLNR